MRVRIAALGACLLGLATCTDDHTPTSPRPPRLAAAVTGGDPVFIGAGDIAECDSHSYATDSLIDTMPGTIFTAGDNAYPNGSDSDYVNCYAPTWGKEKARTYPALGNHEYNLGNANAYFNYFGTSWGYPTGYYSYDLGSWHIIVLNSMGNPYVSTDAGSPQEQWLKADLAAHTNLCTLAIWHHSRFYSPISTTDNGDQASVKSFWVDLYNAGADVVVGGHEHMYERFAPQDANGVADPEAGIREFVVGTGGAGLGGAYTSVRQNSEVRNNATFGVLRLTLHAASYDWQFIPIRGQTFTDSGSGSCHAAKPVVNAGADQLAHPGATVSVNATFIDVSASSPWSYAIAWGDGATTSGAISTQDTIRGSHTYAALGQYTATVAVTNSAGRSGSGSAAVTISNDEVLVGAGNTARCDSQNDDATANLLDRIGGTVFTAGDNAYPSGAATDFSNCYTPTWGRHVARTWPTPGDKDYATSGAAPYYAYFGGRAGDPAKGYYSFDLSAWHVIALNSSLSTSTGSVQEQWLKADLAATNKRCILAYFHYPLFASQNGSQVWSSMLPLWTDLYGARADVVLGAHFQFYERFAQQTPSGVADTLAGIREFVVGTGGQSWSSFGTPLPTSQVRATQTWGVLKLTLHDASYDWQFIPIAGQTFTDAGTTACHTKAPVASVVMSPTSATVPVGGTVQLSATPLDASGNALTDRVVTWTSSAPTVAAVSPSGLVSGVAVGSATITATSGGKSASSAITVGVPVASVAVSPASATVSVGGTQQLTATPLDANGNPLSGRTVTWTPDASGVATVSASGLVSAVAAGSATITATSEGKSGSSAVTVPVPVASVAVSPAPATVAKGSTVQLSATLSDASGNPLTGRTVTWTSSAPGIATVDGTGLVTGVAAGSATITATSEGKSGSSAITVTAMPVASVAVSPSSAGALVGATVQLTATALDKKGHSLTGCAFAWTSSASEVATVSASGLVTGVAVGSATITATCEGQSGTSAITVNPIPVASVAVSPASAAVGVGATVQLTATPLDANGNPLTGRSVTWTSSAPSVATVDGTGLVTGVATGPATITGASEGKSGSSAITVSVPVATVTVSPPSATVSIGTTAQLTATPLDANGNALTGRTVTWTTGAPGVATVDGTGLVTALATGSVTITATSEGKNGSSAITVPVPVASVTVSPASATLAVGATQQLTATPLDANGNPLTGRTVTWVSSAPSVATVDGTGLVTALAGGATTITATSEGKSGSSAITVPVPVASLTVSPGSATVAVGATQQLSATPLDANGNPLTGRAVTWVSGNTAVATVSSSGLVTAVAAGSVTITATSEGKTGSSAITVPVPVASVTVSPAPASVQVGTTVQLTATPLDANGNPLGGRTVTWTTSASAVATVSTSGLVTGVAVGSATITATSEGKSGSSAVTVNPVPVASVAVSPASATVATGASVQLTATPLDANGNPLSGRTVTWASGNTAVATVSTNGLVTGVGGGSAAITATSEGKTGTSAVTVTTGFAPVTLVGAGNIARCDQTHDDSTAMVINGIPGTVFTAGSNTYSTGALTDFTNCYGPSWGQLLARTRPAVGAKDYQTPGAAGYWQYFHPSVAVGDSGTYYYSYDLGAWHVVVLNSEISMSAGSSQEQWLKADLASSAKRCQLAVFGHPRFSSTGTQIWSSALPIWQDLYAAGAEIVLNGHYRVYERFAPQTPGGVLDAQAGIRQITIGTGGITSDTFYTALAPNSEVRATKLYGVLRLTLADGSYSWQFVQAPNESPAFTDSGNGSCH